MVCLLVIFGFACGFLVFGWFCFLFLFSVGLYCCFSDYGCDTFYGDGKLYVILIYTFLLFCFIITWGEDDLWYGYHGFWWFCM